MKIETTKQIEKTELCINDVLDIHLEVSNGTVKVRLFERMENIVWFIARDWEGNEHAIDLNYANSVIVEHLLSNPPEPVEL